MHACIYLRSADHVSPYFVRSVLLIESGVINRGLVRSPHNLACVCMYVCMYVCVHVCMRALHRHWCSTPWTCLSPTQPRLRACVCMCMCASMYSCMYVCYVYMGMYAYVLFIESGVVDRALVCSSYIRMHIYIYISCLRTYIHLHTYTYIHIGDT